MMRQNNSHQMNCMIIWEAEDSVCFPFLFGIQPGKGGYPIQYIVFEITTPSNLPISPSVHGKKLQRSPLRLIPPPCIWKSHPASMYQELSFRCTRCPKSVKNRSKARKSKRRLPACKRSRPETRKKQAQAAITPKSQTKESKKQYCHLGCVNTFIF